MFASKNNRRSDVFIINKFPSFLTLVPLKFVHGRAKSGTRYHLIIIKGKNLPFPSDVFPALTPASPALPAFLQSKRQDGPRLVFKNCCGMDVKMMGRGKK